MVRKHHYCGVAVLLCKVHSHSDCPVKSKELRNNSDRVSSMSGKIHLAAFYHEHESILVS